MNAPPPPDDAEPEPSLADAPPPPSGAPGPLAFELREDSDLGPLDEPAASSAVDEAAVPSDETEEFTPPWAEEDGDVEDDDDTAEHGR